MGECDGTGDPAMTGRGWRGYDLRATLPAVAMAIAASVALLAGRWCFTDLSELADHVGALAVYGMALAVWPALLLALLYRTVTYTYRITDRAVLVDRGFMWPPELPLWLAELTAVETGAGWVSRRLGIGWVRLHTADGRAVVLTGVRDPEAFAAEVRAAATRAPAGGQPGEPV